MPALIILSPFTFNIKVSSFENETSDVIIFIGNKTSAKFSKEYGISYQLPELPLGTAYLRGMKFLNKHIVFL